MTEYLNKQCAQIIAVNQKDENPDLLRSKGQDQKNYSGKTHVVEQG